MKEYLPILFTDEGMHVSFKDMHVLKTFSPINAKEEGFLNVTLLSSKQFLKALSPIKWTEAGMTISFSLWQSLNVEKRIETKDEESVTLSKLSQSSKIVSPISVTKL